jgi:general secretion pathway protein L
VSGTLFLFPLADEPAAFAWARVRGRGKPPSRGRASAEEPLTPGAGERVALIVPGEDVALHAVEPPTRSLVQALVAARFAIEDDLAEPLEDVEVMLAGRRGREEGREREVVVVSRARLALWRAGLEAIGLAPDHAAPDYALLPAAAGEVLVVDQGQRVLVRGKGLGLAVDAALAPGVLAAALARRPEDAVRLLSDRPDDLLPPAARDGRRVELAPAPGDAEMLALHEDGLESGLAIDLASAWRARRAAAPLGLASWRAAAGLAAAVGVSFLALLGAETLALRRHAAAAEAEAERLLLAAFPDMGRVVNPRAQLRERLGLRGAAGSASFLELSAILSESLRDIATVEVETLRYDAGEGLSASLVYSSYADVERLKAGIEARGGRVAEGAARMRGDRMTGDIVVARP